MALMTFEELVHIVRSVFVRNGMSDENSMIIATNCVSAERDGAASHGLFRVSQYVSSLKSGAVDGHAKPALDLDSAASVVSVDARNGFAQPALELSRQPAIEKARAAGISIVTIRDSHHLSALWLDVEPFAGAKLIALAFVNSIPRVVPWGGREPVLGTNPMAFAVPREHEPPLIFDQASSAMAFGEIALAAKAGHPVSPGVGVDRRGQPTTIAQAIIDGGALLPFGGHKGSAITLMVELLAAALTGSNFSFEVGSSAAPGTRTVRTGELVILIDPRRVGASNFYQRVDVIIDKLMASGVKRLPGNRRHQNRMRSLSEGIAVSDAMLATLNGYL